jgi:predicted metal-dependent hydrolase
LISPNALNTRSSGTTEKIISIPGVGEVLCRKHRGARRISVHVSAAKGVRVTLPFYAAFRDAVHVVSINKDWIETAREKARLNEKQALPLRNKLAELDPAEAVKSLVSRLEDLAAKYGFHYAKVSVRNQRTRWGSCSSNRALSLNIKLMLLPGELIDYVLLHELVHTRVHNHSRVFYAELDKLVPNRRQIVKRLKEFKLYEL